MFRYSPSKNGFYPDDIDYANRLPEDLIDITDELYQYLISGQNEAFEICAGSDGSPILRPTPPPQAVIPNTVAMRQARLALLRAGHYEAVQQAVATLPNDAGIAARIEWEFATTVERNSPIVTLLAGAIGLDESDLDDLFATAVTL